MPETRWRLTEEELDSPYGGNAMSQLTLAELRLYLLPDPTCPSAQRLLKLVAKQKAAEAQLLKIALVLKGEAHLDIDGQGVALAVLPQAILDSLYEEAGLVQKGRDE